MAIYLGHLQHLTSMRHIRCSTKFAANLNFQVKNHAAELFEPTSVGAESKLTNSGKSEARCKIVGIFDDTV